MEVRFFTRNVELPGDIKDYMEKKLVKIEKFFDRILDTQVVLNYKRGMNVVEITANVNGVIMRGEDYAPDLRKAFDKALKNIERQVKKHKSYLTDRARMKVQDVSFDIDPEIIAASAPEKEEPHEIVKRKKFSVDVMTPLEATMQMDLLGHSFFIFKNDETGEIKRSLPPRRRRLRPPRTEININGLRAAQLQLKRKPLRKEGLFLLRVACLLKIPRPALMYRRFGFIIGRRRSPERRRFCL